MREYYETDGEIIQKAFRKKGYDISLQEAISFWSEKSETNDSGWLMLPENDLEEIFELIMSETSAPEILDRKQTVNDLETLLTSSLPSEKRDEAQRILTKIKEYI